MICQNLQRIRFEIEEAANRCGRDPKAIQLLAVSKRMPVKDVAEANQCGQCIFGENYIQDAQEKITQLDPALQWHFIGHLQSNKAGVAAALFQVIETVDRLKIARALNKHAGVLGKRLDVLVQVNIGHESQKSGVLPEDAEALLVAMQACANLRIRGLMTIPPRNDDPEAGRPWFRALKQLADQLAAAALFYDNQAVELSMGMSRDFKVAVEEGSTMIRVGTAIFGPRPG